MQRLPKVRLEAREGQRNIGGEKSESRRGAPLFSTGSCPEGEKRGTDEGVFSLRAYAFVLKKNWVYRGRIIDQGLADRVCWVGKKGTGWRGKEDYVSSRLSGNFYATDIPLNRATRESLKKRTQPARHTFSGSCREGKGSKGGGRRTKDRDWL